MKRKTPEEVLFCLVNNDGNQIRRPRMTLNLLSEAEITELKNGTSIRRRTANLTNKNAETRNQPADLHQTQLFSKKIRESVNDYLEKVKET